MEGGRGGEACRPAKERLNWNTTGGYGGGGGACMSGGSGGGYRGIVKMLHIFLFVVFMVSCPAIFLIIFWAIFSNQKRDSK